MNIKELTKELVYLPLPHRPKPRSRCLQECAYHIIRLETWAINETTRRKETPLILYLTPSIPRGSPRKSAGAIHPFQSTPPRKSQIASPNQNARHKTRQTPPSPRQRKFKLMKGKPRPKSLLEIIESLSLKSLTLPHTPANPMSRDRHVPHDGPTRMPPSRPGKPTTPKPKPSLPP